MKILVIGSNRVSRDSLTALVSSSFSEANVITAPDGSKGLHLAYDEQPDLILLEGNLVGLDSFRTAKVLRHLPETRQIPLIALTEQDTPEDDQWAAGLKATCHSLLTKPVSSEKLVHAITALNGEGGNANFPATNC